MKNILLFLSVMLFSTAIFAQAPESFNYQAVVRDQSGNPVVNKSVGFRISILQTSMTGSPIYTETHNASTNDQGLVTLKIGEGSSSNNFSAIDWSGDKYFIKVEVDPEGGSNYIPYGTSQLLSVPYALEANKLNGNDSEYYTNADNMNSGTVSTDRYSAIQDLTDEGKLDNNAGDDLLTRDQADTMYISGIDTAYFDNADNLDAGTVSTDRYSAIDDLTAEGKLDDNAGDDLLTRDQADGKYISEITTATNSGLQGGTGSGTADLSVNPTDFNAVPVTKYDYNVGSIDNTPKIVTQVTITIPKSGYVVAIGGATGYFRSATVSNNEMYYYLGLSSAGTPTDWVSDDIEYNANGSPYFGQRLSVTNVFYFSTSGTKTIYMEAKSDDPADIFNAVAPNLTVFFIPE